MTVNMDYRSPSAQFFDDVNNNRLYQKDPQNYINVLSAQQLNTLDNVSVLDIFLSTGNIVEPHYHQNAAELVFCVSGGMNVSFINPFTNEVSHYHITPGQVVNIPQGWWHWELATAENTHVLAIFNASVPEVIFGSDILRLTPSEVWAYTYCLNDAKVKDALAPIRSTTFLGPPLYCQQVQGYGDLSYAQAPGQSMHYYQQPNQQPY
jgi:quercetin dioxygenase-like cupin family protein